MLAGNVADSLLTSSDSEPDTLPTPAYRRRKVFTRNRIVNTLDECLDIIMIRLVHIKNMKNDKISTHQEYDE